MEGTVKKKVYFCNGRRCIGAWQGHYRRQSRQTFKGARAKGGGAEARPLYKC